MTEGDSSNVFAGSIPQIYQRYLVPLLFDEYAADVAARVADLVSGPCRVLEVAAGTGAVTRQLARRLPPSTSILATDLNQPMIDHASAIGTARPVQWQLADAMALPFGDESFDVVICQFGVMFLPDKGAAFAQMRRVLCRGGTLLFSVWDRIEDNEFADVVTRSVGQLFPADPPRFLARIPHGYHDLATIAEDVQRGGFGPPQVQTDAKRSRASAAQVVAHAYCQGTPLRNEIEGRDPSRLVEATDRATHALVERFGSGDIEGKIQAHTVVVRR